jgi:hypothetical protein
MPADQEQLQLRPDRALTHAESRTLQHLAERVEGPLEPPREALVVGVVEPVPVDLDSHAGHPSGCSDGARPVPPTDLP